MDFQGEYRTIYKKKKKLQIFLERHRKRDLKLYMARLAYIQIILQLWIN